MSLAATLTRMDAHLRRIAAGRVVNRSDVDDVMQTVWVAVLTLDYEPDEPEFFLLITVRNAAVDVLRRRNVGVEMPLDDLPPDIPVPANDLSPERRVQSAQDLRSLLTALSQVERPAARDAFALCLLRGLDLPEVARLQGVCLRQAQRYLLEATTAIAAAIGHPISRHWWKGTAPRSRT